MTAVFWFLSRMVSMGMLLIMAIILRGDRFSAAIDTGHFPATRLLHGFEFE